MSKIVGVVLTIFFFGAMLMFVSGEIGLGGQFVPFFETLTGG